MKHEPSFPFHFIFLSMTSLLHPLDKAFFLTFFSSTRSTVIRPLNLFFLTIAVIFMAPWVKIWRHSGPWEINTKSFRPTVLLRPSILERVLDAGGLACPLPLSPSSDEEFAILNNASGFYLACSLEALTWLRFPKVYECGDERCFG